MDLKEIKALLEKYYRGETSLGEEELLKNYFKDNEGDSEIAADKDIFLYHIQEQENENNIPDISEDILNTLQNNEVLHKSHKNKSLSYVYLRIAASIAILIASYFVLKNQVFNTDQEIPIAETYNNPEDAYKQAKETLLYVSALLNNGTEHLEPIHLVNENTQRLNTLSNFNKGLKELKPIENYSKAEKYLKQ